MATCDLTTLESQACDNKFKCLTQDQYMALVLQLLCNISSTSGGGSAGLTQAFTGSGPPGAQVPAAGAGVYYDYTNKVTYNWNPIAGAWE